MPVTISLSFQRKKQRILEALNVPETEYTDLSPKGSVDVQIRELIDEINGLPGLVTTSSCSGRVSVFVEGRKGTGKPQQKSKDENHDEMNEVAERTVGGRWLYVSHDAFDATLENSQNWHSLLGLNNSQMEKGNEILGTRSSLIHFKFEPMVDQNSQFYSIQLS